MIKNDLQYPSINVRPDTIDKLCNECTTRSAFFVWSLNKYIRAFHEAIALAIVMYSDLNDHKGIQPRIIHSNYYIYDYKTYILRKSAYSREHLPEVTVFERWEFKPYEPIGGINICEE